MEIAREKVKVTMGMVVEAAAEEVCAMVVAVVRVEAVDIPRLVPPVSDQTLNGGAQTPRWSRLMVEVLIEPR